MKCLLHGTMVLDMLELFRFGKNNKDAIEVEIFLLFSFPKIRKTQCSCLKVLEYKNVG